MRNSFVASDDAGFCLLLALLCQGYFGWPEARFKQVGVFRFYRGDYIVIVLASISFYSVAAVSYGLVSSTSDEFS